MPTDREMLDLMEEILPSIDYLITYRIVDDAPCGTREERYERLVEELRDSYGASTGNYFRDEGHVATSSWTIRTRETTAAAVCRRMSAHLVAGQDLLEVFQIVIENQARL